MPDRSGSRPPASPILVSLSSFGAWEVRRHGQCGFAELAHAAGADGVEVRGELLTDVAELARLAAFVREAALDCVFSSPEGLWREDGGFAADALERALEHAQALGAARLKMSIGGFGEGSEPGLATLAARLAGSPVELLIENDQTEAAGTLPAVRRFFDEAAAAALPLGMTFDVGNWHWTGECPLEAARACAPRVRYVHCKGVQRRRGRWIAAPLVESAAAWRPVLRSLPPDLPWAIEYPLQGEDLLAATRGEITRLRALAAAHRAPADLFYGSAA